MRKQRGARALIAMMMAAATAACMIQAPTGGKEGGNPWTQLLDAATDPADWVTYGGTFDEQRFSGLTAISDQTVKRLGLAWSFEFDTNRAQIGRAHV